MPSVLIETGYLTNQQEERYLNSRKGQDQVVSNIMTAFRQYMKQTSGEHAGTSGQNPAPSGEHAGAKNVNGNNTPERERYKKRMKRSKHLLTLLAGGTFFALTSFHPGDRHADFPGDHQPADSRPATGPRPAQKQAIRTIIIDPGHGGFDNGTAGLFSKEKDVALAISLKLGPAINEAFPDIKVVYTRTTDVMPGVGVDMPPGIYLSLRPCRRA